MKDFESFQCFSSALIAAKLILLVWDFNKTQVMMKFEPFYAFNDRLVLFSDIKKAPNKTSKPYATSTYQRWETAASENKGFNEAVCGREINF